MPLYAPPSQNAVQKSLDAEVLAGATTVTLNNVTGIQNLAGVAVIDRVDSNGTSTPSKREYISFTGTSGNNLTGVTRGLAGSTDQVHAVGAVVEFVPDAVWAQSIYDALSNVVSISTLAVDTTKIVTPSGTQTLTNKTLTSPKVGTDISDTNGNELIKVVATTSAVNEVQLTNASTGNRPIVEATGGDSTISTHYRGKSAFNSHTGEYSNGNSGTSKEINWANGDRQVVTMTGNCTFTFANAAAGQTLTLRTVQDATGGRTHTFPTLKWPGGTVGTPGTGANDINLYIFYYDGSNYLTQLAADFS